MHITYFFALLGLSRLGNASGCEDCTFQTIVSSEDLVWCPCNGTFFCARLDVGVQLPQPSFPSLPGHANKSDFIGAA